MRTELLWLGAVLLTMGCPKGSEPTTIVHQSKVTPSSSHDTLIKYSKESSAKDTFVMHIAAFVPDSCLKIPKPPGCPPYLAAVKIDTIPRP